MPSACIRFGALSRLLLLLLVWPSLYASDAETALTAMQKRYASLDTISGSFRLHYTDLGMDRVESGRFWLKKPAFMRWEYDRPKGQLFVADGKESFLYVPQDNQVTVQPLNEADLRNTPLKFLLGSEDIGKTFSIVPEPASAAEIKGTYVVRLIPKGGNQDYTDLVLEIGRDTGDLRRLMMRETSGGILEYVFSDLKPNAKIGKDAFRFKIPRDAEVLRMESSE